MILNHLHSQVVHYFREPYSHRPDLHTDGHGNWERRHGESWEIVYDTDDLQAAFAEWQKTLVYLAANQRTTNV